MPELNPSRPSVYCAGNAGDGGVVAVSGKVVLGPSAGNAHWLNASEIACQYYTPTQAPSLVAVHVDTGAVRPLWLHGVNKIVAGYGHWYADKILDGLPVDFNVRAFDSAGNYAWFPWNGTGFAYKNVTVSTQLGPEDPIQLIDGGVVWAEAGQVQSWNLPDFPTHPVVVPGGFGWLKAAKRGGVWWLAYQSYSLAAVVLHPATELRGYSWPAPLAYRLDMAKTSDPIVRLVWSTNAADDPAHIVVVDSNVSDARITLGPRPTRSDRFWFAPNIASADLLTLFDDVSVLNDVGVFQFYIQHILFSSSNQGPNNYNALVQKDAFRKLKNAGIPIALEAGSVKEGDCKAVNNQQGLRDAVQKVKEAGGDVSYLSIDEPLAAAKRGCASQTLSTTADAVAEYIHLARNLGITHVIWLEAWPFVSMENQTLFLQKLIDRSAKPDGWRVDVEWPKTTSTAGREALAQARTVCDQHGMTFGCFINSTADPIATDAAHYQNLQALSRKIHTMQSDVPHVCVQSWAFRTSLQDVPNNLGANGLLASLADTISVFGKPVDPPPPDTQPIPETKTMSTYGTPVLGFSQGQIEPHPDGGSWLAVRKPAGKFLCVTPEGTVEERDKPGPWERFRKSKKGNLIAERDGNRVYVLALEE